MLLEKSTEWYGSRPLELEALILDYNLMFTDNIYMWLREYTNDLTDRLLRGKCLFESAIPLLNLLEVLHDAVIPAFSDIDLAGRPTYVRSF